VEGVGTEGTGPRKELRIYLLGNKMDLITARQVTQEAHTGFIAEHGLNGGMWVSARSGEALMRSFYMAAMEVAGLPVTEQDLAVHDKVLLKPPPKVIVYPINTPPFPQTSPPPPPFLFTSNTPSSLPDPLNLTRRPHTLLLQVLTATVSLSGPDEGRTAFADAIEAEDRAAREAAEASCSCALS
jgi:hypothetical protein